MTSNGIIHLKSKRDKPVRQRHPWIFSGAIARVEGNPQRGDIVDVLSASGEWLARGYFNQQSQMQVRLLTWQVDQLIDEDFWRNHLIEAIQLRENLPFTQQPETGTTAFRLVNAESDGLPGLIVDKYGEYLVMQCLTAGIDSRKNLLADILVDLTGCQGIVERSDVAIRRKEGLGKESGVLVGKTPPENMQVEENGHSFWVNLLTGQKTGLYLDQRDNRQLVCQEAFVAGKSILNVFSYTGGFALYAAANGAKRIINIDSSFDALTLAEKNMESNGWQSPHHEYIAGDAFQVLRHFRDEGQQFDMVILDPPKFAQSQRDVEKACRGYKDLNLLAMQLLRHNGLLATFSCSGLVSADLFQKVVFGAVVDSGKNAQVLYQLHQAPDHPIALTFPESNYLNGLLCKVTSG